MKALVRDLSVATVLFALVAFILWLFIGSTEPCRYDYLIELTQIDTTVMVTVTSNDQIITIPFDSLEEHLLRDNM